MFFIPLFCSFSYVTILLKLSSGSGLTQDIQRGEFKTPTSNNSLLITSLLTIISITGEYEYDLPSRRFEFDVYFRLQSWRILFFFEHIESIYILS